MTRQHWPAVGLAANANACARRPSLPLLAPRAVSFQPSVTDLQSMAVTPSTSFPLPKALLRMTDSLFLPLPSISPTYFPSFLPSFLLLHLCSSSILSPSSIIRVACVVDLYLYHYLIVIPTAGL